MLNLNEFESAHGQSGESSSQSFSSEELNIFQGKGT